MVQTFTFPRIEWIGSIDSTISFGSPFTVHTVCRVFLFGKFSTITTTIISFSLSAPNAPPRCSQLSRTSGNCIERRRSSPNVLHRINRRAVTKSLHGRPNDIPNENDSQQHPCINPTTSSMNIPNENDSQQHPCIKPTSSMNIHEHPRSSSIILDHPRSSSIILDHPRSSLIILDHP